MSYLSADKIRIFVSSRLEECADERIMARDAIYSLNHEPIMFEAAGARPYPPRSIYLEGVESSLFFVGIYKEGYGYIAEGMNISGLEDEYRYANNLGKPQLLYIKKNCNRDERLAKLISEFSNSFITVAFYEQPSDLYERLREDIASLIAEYVYRGQRASAISPAQPSAIINELVPPNRRISRPQVEAALLNQLENTPLVTVIGPLGAGKTVFLATLASQHEWLFIQCGERTPREILLDVTNGVRARLGLDQIAFSNIQEAASALKAGWLAVESITLVLDDIRTEEVANAVLSVIEPLGNRHIVISSRDSHLLPGIATFKMPLLQIDEVREFVARNRSQAMLSGELEELMRLSEGNLLYLRYYTSGEPGKFEETIAGYELKALHSLSSRAKEALNYIALSSRPLQLEDLMELMSCESGSVEEISVRLAESGALLSDTTRGYIIFHSHAKKTVRGAISESPQLLKFYVARLAKWFASKHDYTAAFTVLDCNGADISSRLLELAGQHALVQGDVGAALKLLNRRLILAREAGDDLAVRNLMVALASTQSHAGRTDEALQTLEAAQMLHSTGDLFIPINEVKLSILALVKGDPSAISELTIVKQRYIEAGKNWEAARVALDISASLIRRADYKQAVDEAEFALTTFEVHKDSYGARVAKLNLLSAASALPERAEQARALMSELNSSSEISPRQRAALCNLLGRIARENNDLKGAKAFAEEAIIIGRSLGDVSVVVTNLINSGNAFRQEGVLDSALNKYEAADKIAHEASLVQSEAWAQELIASVFNRKGDSKRAIYHARYAVSLAKDGVSGRTEAEAYEEMANAYENIKDFEKACDAWLHCTDIEFKLNKDGDAGYWAFLRAARLFYKEHASRAYIEAYRRIFSSDIKQSEEGLLVFEILVAEFSSLLACMPLQHVFELTVYHARLTFDNLPKVLVRQVYMHLMAQIVSLTNGYNDNLKSLRATLALTMALPTETVLLADIVEIGEKLAYGRYNLSYRAHSDGAAHWTISVQFAKPLIVTIGQLDDRPDVALVTLCLALVLLSFSEEISEDVLSGIVPLRDEANIQVVNYDEAKELLPLEKAGIHSMDETCAVTRATDAKNYDDTPIIVFTRGDITSDWLVGEGKGNSGQFLFSKVLVELVYHLFAGEIELESLYPKVVSLIKKTII